MLRAIIGFMSVGLLFTMGCSQPPAGGPTGSPKATLSASATASATPGVSASASPAASVTPGGTASPGASVTPGGSASPSATGSPTAGGFDVKKFVDETGIEFKVPSGYKPSLEKDGELQLENSDGDFVAIQTGDKMDETFDKTMAIMKSLGKDTFKAEGAPETKENEGLKGKMQAGTLEAKGAKSDWFVIVLDGKKPLRIAAMGPKLKDSKDFKELMDSIKKKS